MIVSCPRCSAPTSRSGFPAWTIIVSILFFPFGLLTLLAGRKPTVCRSCGLAWQA